jgi:hypothetical protein
MPNQALAWQILCLIQYMVLTGEPVPSGCSANG